MASHMPPPMRHTDASMAPQSVWSSQAGQQIQGYECGKCKHFMQRVPSNSTCPKCGTIFAYINEADGRVVDTGKRKFIFGIPLGGDWYFVPGPKMIIGLIVLIFGGVAAFFRKLFAPGPT
jgi:hypothetical protein